MNWWTDHFVDLELPIDFRSIVFIVSLYQYSGTMLAYQVLSWVLFIYHGTSSMYGYDSYKKIASLISGWNGSCLFVFNVLLIMLRSKFAEIFRTFQVKNIMRYNLVKHVTYQSCCFMIKHVKYQSCCFMFELGHLFDVLARLLWLQFGLFVKYRVHLNYGVYFTTKLFLKMFDKCFNKNSHKNLNQNFDENFGKSECVNKNFYKILSQNSDKNYGRSEICSYNGILCDKTFLDIRFLDTQNLTKLSVINFCSIYVSTVNYIYLLKTCHEKNLKISYIENSAAYLTAAYLTAFLLFDQISESKSLKIILLFLYCTITFYLFKVNLQAHFSKHYKFKKLLGSNSFILNHGS